MYGTQTVVLTEAVEFNGEAFERHVSEVAVEGTGIRREPCPSTIDLGSVSGPRSLLAGRSLEQCQSKTTVTFRRPAGIFSSRGPVAPTVEQRTFNPKRVGSSPTGPTVNTTDLLASLLRAGCGA
jgi:hypothetical protein